MADWNSFLRSDDFRSYRKKQIEMVAKHLDAAAFQMITGGCVDLPSFQGKLEMIKLFLKLPQDLTQDNETNAILRLQLNEDTANLTQFLIRRSLAEEE